jgi:hypothetical protein
MSFKTYAVIRQKVERDLDLEDEVHISSAELMGYANEGIKEAESIILSIVEDYFLDRTTITLESGTAEYDFPSDIFADKIRKLVYRNGATVYTIPRIRSSYGFEAIERMTSGANSGTSLQYLMTNDLSSGRKITFYPTPQESGELIACWYIRNAREVTADSDVVDIPEFHKFIEQYMKVRCYEKEMHPNLAQAQAWLDRERERMVLALTNRVPDDDDTLEMDLSFYGEHN